MSSQELTSSFLAFRNECVWLQTTYTTFSILYQSGDQQISEVMTATAPAFFQDLNLILLDYFVLQVCRVTDPAFTNIKNAQVPNLTVGWINQQLKAQQLNSPAIEAAANGLKPFRASLLSARNKLVAHADQSAVLGGKALGKHTDEERKVFFSSLYSYVDEVGVALGLGPLDFRVTSAAGDCSDLIRCLKAGQHASRFL